MNIQNNSESAFVRSMKRSSFFSEWRDYTECREDFIDEENNPSPLEQNTLDRCNRNAERIEYQSGSHVRTRGREMFIFTVLVDQFFDEGDIDFSNEIGKLLTSLDKAERDLKAISVREEGVSGVNNSYLLQLVFTSEI